MLNPSTASYSCQVDLPLGVRWPDRRPLVPLGACEAILDKLPEELWGEIEDGRLSVAWHVESLGIERRCIRVWRECLVARVAGREQPEPGDEELISAVLPVHREAFTVQELRRRLTVSGGHIIHLIRDGLIETAADTPWRRGAGGSPRVTRASVARFLGSRRIGGET